LPVGLARQRSTPRFNAAPPAGLPTNSPSRNCASGRGPRQLPIIVRPNRKPFSFNCSLFTAAAPGSGQQGIYRGGEPASPATLDLLFTFTALSGQLGDFDTLPDNWIIEWQHFVDTGAGAANKARRIDTKLAAGLFDLRDLQGEPQRPADAARLAVRNLLRGYGLRMPTGPWWSRSRRR
jgi:hypothetical protein